MLIIRHGESQPARPGQAFPLTDGHADPPLDEQGQHEAVHVAERLGREEISAVYVTSLQRTQQTAAPLAAELGLTPIVEPDLREVHLGEWEGPTFRIKMRLGDPLAKRLMAEERWDVIPGAEPIDALTSRVRAAITRIADAHPDQRVAVFAHGGVIGMICHLATESRRFAFVGAENGSLTHLVVSGDRWILRRFNDTGHLHTDLDRPVQPLQ